MQFELKHVEAPAKGDMTPIMDWLMEAVNAHRADTIHNLNALGGELEILRQYADAMQTDLANLAARGSKPERSEWVDPATEQAYLCRAQAEMIDAQRIQLNQSNQREAQVAADEANRKDKLTKADIAVQLTKAVMYLGLAILFVTLAVKVN